MLALTRAAAALQHVKRDWQKALQDPPPAGIAGASAVGGLEEWIDDGPSLRRPGAWAPFVVVLGCTRAGRGPAPGVSTSGAVRPDMTTADGMERRTGGQTMDINVPNSLKFIALMVAQCPRKGTRRPLSRSGQACGGSDGAIK